MPDVWTRISQRGPSWAATAASTREADRWMPAMWSKVSWPRTACCRKVGSSRSPFTTLTSGADRCTRDGSRATTVTEKGSAPSVSRRSASWLRNTRPERPVAPVTRMRFGAVSACMVAYYSNMCLSFEKMRRFSSSPGVTLGELRRLSIALFSAADSFSGM